MAVGFVHRTQVVEVYAVALLDAFQRGDDEACHVGIAFGSQVDGATAPGVGGQSVLGEVDGYGVEECQEVGHAMTACHAQEAPLTRLSAPVVAAVGLQQTLGAGGGVDLRIAPLLTAASTQVEAPQAEADAQRLSVVVGLEGEEPVGHLLLLALVVP